MHILLKNIRLVLTLWNGQILDLLILCGKTDVINSLVTIDNIFYPRNVNTTTQRQNVCDDQVTIGEFKKQVSEIVELLDKSIISIFFSKALFFS